MIESENIYINAFNEYRGLGMDPLPIPHKDGHPTKGPREIGWQVKAASGGYVESDFCQPCNIGNLLGGSQNVTDIDCDSPEAVVVAGTVMSDFMRTHGMTMVFGRQSKAKSHYIFFTDHSLPSEKISDPTDSQCVIEYRCVNADGQRGAQTVFPPSINYNPATGGSEHVRFETDSSPVIATVLSADLRKAYVLIGVIALLAKHFPLQAERHNTILALAGVFARSGISEKKATALISNAYRHSKGYNRDQNKAESDVASSVSRT